MRDHPDRPNREVLDLSLPREIGHQKVKLAAAELRGLVGQFRAAESSVKQLEDARRAAENADRDALSIAIRGGRPDPGSQAVEAANVELLEGRRRLEAIGRAAEASYADLLATVERVEGTWRATLERDLERRRANLRTAVANVSEAHAAVTDSLATRAWVTVLLDGRPARFNPAGFLGALPGLAGRNGDPLPVGAALAALADLAAEPPKPTALAEAA